MCAVPAVTLHADLRPRQIAPCSQRTCRVACVLFTEDNSRQYPHKTPANRQRWLLSMPSVRMAIRTNSRGGYRVPSGNNSSVAPATEPLGIVLWFR